MAILRGFPPSNTISAGVRVAEKDLSFIAPEQSFHRAGLIGFASKGPVGVPTRVASTRQLNTIFGFPHPEVSDPYLIYAAQQYLLVANELFIVRVADTAPTSDTQAQTASVDVPSAGGLVAIESDLAGPYSFSDDSFFRWRLNGILSSKTLVVLSDANRPAPETGNAYSCEDLVTALNEQLTSEDGIEFECTNDDRIVVKSLFAYGPDSSIELVSVQNAIYGGSSSVTGLGTGMTVASTTGGNDRYPNDSYQVAGTYDFSGISSPELMVVIDGTDNVNIDNVVQTIDLSSLGSSASVGQIVTEINDQITLGTIPGGFEAVATGDNLTLRTLHHGRDAKLLVKTASTANAVFGFDGITARGTSPEGTTGDVAVDTYGIVNGDENTSNDISFSISADSPGIEGNSTQVVITNNLEESTFKIEVYNNGNQVESWGGLSKDQSLSSYVETYLTLVSDWIRVTDNTSIGAPAANGTYNLSGGTDGIPADPDEQDSLIIGSSLSGSGLYAFSEPEQLDLDLIAAPGRSSTSVVLALIDVCQNFRTDAMAIIDPPFGLSVREIIQWQNGVHPLNNNRFDSDFAALFWPWLKIRDSYNRVDVWVPPSGSVIATFARSDFLSAPWFAAAGQTRGLVPGILDVFARPTLEEKDSLYGNANAINPIISYSDLDGFYIWGNKTLQRRTTALNRINVRRMLFLIEKRIRRDARALIFDPNDEIFRSSFITICENILSEVRIGRGIDEYRVEAGPELNTSDVIDRNEFRARIGVIPTKAVEFIFVEFSLFRTGSFSEGTDTF